jgi:hypothetical protein
VSLTLSSTLYLQRQPLLRIFNSCIHNVSRFNFRIGGRWASEDLFNAEEEGEADLMVNESTHDANDNDLDDLFDELIPLKPISRKSKTTRNTAGRFLDSYGSTQFFGIS